MPKPPTADCPMCGRSCKAVGLTGTQFYCVTCAGLFDDAPDEGGTHSDRNPAARIEREERKQQRRPSRQSR